MNPRPPRSTLTCTPLPYTTLFRPFPLRLLHMGDAARKRPENHFEGHVASDVKTGRDLLTARQLPQVDGATPRSEEHTSELQSLMRTSYAVFCLKKKNTTTIQ